VLRNKGENSNSTCVIVTGVHRGGTSCIAGVLHNLGINMGDDLLPASSSNPKGHFEDRELYELHEYLIGNWKQPLFSAETIYLRKYRDLIAKRIQKYTIWGVKDPRLCYLFPILYYLIKELDGEALVVNVQRPIEASVFSLMKRDKVSIEEAYRITLAYRLQLDQSLSSIYRLDLEYNNLVDNPILEIKRLVSFLGYSPSRKQIQAAEEFVDRKLRHWE